MNADISLLDVSDSEELDWDQCASRFTRATRDCGFVYLRINAEVDQAIHDVRKAQRLFFAQSDTQKNRVAVDQNNRGYLASGKALMSGAKHHDQKEVFFWGPELSDDDPDLLAGIALCGKNQWPTDQTQFRHALLNYSEQIRKIGDLLLQIVARSLNAPADFFAAYYQRPMLRGQLLRYPPTLAGSERFGVAPHSDFGCITLLLQETDGLEVQFPDGRWVAAPPLEHTLIINIGDLLERWSNRQLPSTRHRVRNLSGDDRYSIAMFYDPSPTAVVDAQDLLPDEKALYPPVVASEYILSRNRESFQHYKD